MENWDKIKIYSTVFASIFTPIIVGYIGYSINKSITERELQGRFVELGVTILHQEPTEQSRNLRNWAIEILNRYSGVPIDTETKEALLNDISMPKVSYERKKIYIHKTDGKLIITDNIDFKLNKCLIENNTVICDITLIPKKLVNTIQLRSLPIHSPAHWPVKFHEGEFILGNQRFIHYNYPITKRFSVEPEKANKLEIVLYIGERFDLKKYAESVSISFEVNDGLMWHRIIFDNAEVE